MPSFPTQLALIGSGFTLGVILTRLARDCAARIGLVDAPDGRRKLQTRPVPVAGGVAVFLATLLSLAAGSGMDRTVAAVLLADTRQTTALLLAALLVVILGLADDRYNLRPWHKLAGQTLAVSVYVLGADNPITAVSVFGWSLELGVLALPFTMLWLLACVNALNLIDGMDGLLGTIAGIGLLSLAAMAALTGQPFAVVVALTLAGAVFGFLFWNLPPATIYMGDAGSMLVGLVVGAIAIPAALKGPATVALAAPVGVLVLPLFDTTAAVVRRKLSGRSFASPDRGHLHHTLLARGLSVRAALVVIAGLALVAAGGAFVGIALNSDLLAIVSAGSVVTALVAGKLFGHTELGLIRARLRRLIGWQSLASPTQLDSPPLAVRFEPALPADVPKRLLADAQDPGE